MKYLLLVLLPLGFCSCYYDHAEDIYPVGNCSPASVSYAANITEILNRNSCVSCHNASLASGAVRLDNYTGVTTVAANGRLWGSINHSPGFVSMPQGLGKISQCDLNKIKIWIDAGQPQ